jgi:hypothetical protein
LEHRARASVAWLACAALLARRRYFRLLVAISGLARRRYFRLLVAVSGLAAILACGIGPANVPPPPGGATSAPLASNSTPTPDGAPLTQSAIHADLVQAAGAACDAKTGTPGAAAYKSGAPNKIVVSDATGALDGSIIDPAWEAASLAELQVAVCIGQPVPRTPTCPYTGGYSIHLTLPSIKVTLVTVRTGGVLAFQSFLSQSTCPSNYEFTKGVFAVDVMGDPPRAAEIHTYIQNHLHQK